MADRSRNAFHLRQAKQYAEQAIAGLERGGESWRDDPVIAAGITHLTEACAEHMGNIPREIQVRYPVVPRQRMADFRNIATHAYHRVDLAIVESIVRDSMPLLLPQIEQMLADGI